MRVKWPIEIHRSPSSVPGGKAMALPSPKNPKRRAAREPLVIFPASAICRQAQCTRGWAPARIRTLRMRYTVCDLPGAHSGRAGTARRRFGHR